MQLSISEVLKTISEQPEEQRVQLLRNTDHPSLRIILQCCFNPAIKWLLPEGAPPYTVNPYPDQEGILLQGAKKLYIFLEGGPELSKLKRETLFIAFLESISPSDAVMMCSIKDKIMPFPGITKEIVLEAFPDLF